MTGSALGSETESHSPNSGKFKQPKTGWLNIIPCNEAV